jgi:hypothetical protein
LVFLRGYAAKNPQKYLSSSPIADAVGAPSSHRERERGVASASSCPIAN